MPDQAPQPDDGCFKRLFNFVGRVMNSPIFFRWLNIGFLFFLLVAIVDLATDVNVAVDIASKQEKYFDMVQEMQSLPFSVNSTYEIIVDSYLQFTDEEKYAYCNVEALGNLIMGVGEKAVDYHTRLNNLKIASVVFLVFSFLAALYAIYGVREAYAKMKADYDDDLFDKLYYDDDDKYAGLDKFLDDDTTDKFEYGPETFKLLIQILEDCPQLIILMLYVVILYEPEGYLCIKNVYDQRIDNFGDWFGTSIQDLRAEADLTKSTTNLFFDTNNADITISSFVSVFNILLFTLLGGNKALKMRNAFSRQKYFLMTILCGSIILFPFCVVLCVHWTDRLNRRNGFFISWIFFLILDALVMVFSGSILCYNICIENVKPWDEGWFGEGWICWKTQKKEIGHLFNKKDFVILEFGWPLGPCYPTKEDPPASLPFELSSEVEMSFSSEIKMSPEVVMSFSSEVEMSPEVKISPEVERASEVEMK